MEAFWGFCLIVIIVLSKYKQYVNRSSFNTSVSKAGAFNVLAMLNKMSILLSSIIKANKLYI